MREFLRKLKNKIMTASYSGILLAAFRVKVYYEDPEQKKNPPRGIYISNHMAHYDGLIMRAIFKRADIYSLVTSVWYDKKWARALLFYENSIPVDRDNPGTKWIHDCKKVLKEGGSVNIFPEGHTSKSDEVMDVFFPGFILLASMVKDAPIIPVAHIGQYKWFFGERKRVLVGKPVYFDRTKFGLEPGKAESYADEFRTMIDDMKKQLREMSK